MPSLFTKPVETLTASDVDELIGWPESLTVEFKGLLPSRERHSDAWERGGNVENYARDKLFKEIVAFANTSGGHLVLGIEEEDEAPPTAKAIIPVLRCVDLAERLSRMAQVIDPPIPLLLVQGVPTTGNAGVVVFRVPASRSAPHRSPDKECYARRGTESKPMNMREIQDMTLAAGRREEFIDAQFARAARQFADWFVAPLELEGVHQATGLRITAVPVGARFDLGRLYGRDDLVKLRESFRIALNGNPSQVSMPVRPTRSRSIVRGVRWTDEDADALIYFDLHSDGIVDFGLRMPPRTGKQLISLTWIIAYVVNVLHVADALLCTAVTNQANGASARC